jgi:hypothetical protein
VNDNDFEEFDTYSFFYSAADGSKDIESHIHPEWDATWTTVLQEFLDFLSGIYGYDLRDQVAVKFKPHRAQEDWSGPTFGDVIRTDAVPQQLDPFENYGGND